MREQMTQRMLADMARIRPSLPGETYRMSVKLVVDRYGVVRDAILVHGSGRKEIDALVVDIVHRGGLARKSYSERTHLVPLELALRWPPEEGP